MQTPEQRKSLIRAGLYSQLEPPANLGQPWGPPIYESSQPIKAFRTTVDEVFREPGEEG